MLCPGRNLAVLRLRRQESGTHFVELLPKRVVPPTAPVLTLQPRPNDTDRPKRQGDGGPGHGSLGRVQRWAWGSSTTTTTSRSCGTSSAAGQTPVLTLGTFHGGLELVEKGLHPIPNLLQSLVCLQKGRHGRFRCRRRGRHHGVGGWDDGNNGRL